MCCEVSVAVRTEFVACKDINQCRTSVVACSGHVPRRSGAISTIREESEHRRLGDGKTIHRCGKDFHLYGLASINIKQDEGKEKNVPA